MLSTQIGLGFSNMADTQEAAFKACKEAVAGFNSAGVDLCIVFASPRYCGPEISDVISTVLKPKNLIGAGSNAIITSQGIMPRGIAILALNSPDIHCGISMAPNLSNSDLRQASFEFAKKTGFSLARYQRQAGIVFCDQIFEESTPYIQGTHEAWGSGFPMITLVGSSDNARPHNLFYQKQIVNNALVGLLLAGDVHVAFSNRHGFKPLGKPRTITQAQGRIIQSIDHKPAIHIYEHYLPTEAQQIRKSFLNSHAALYPLGIYIEAEKQYLLRNPVDILLDGSIVCQGDIPQGAEVHLMIASKEACRKAALEAARELKEALIEKQAKAILFFESNARRKILGRDIFNEIQAIRDVLGLSAHFIGMNTNVQLSPFNSLNGIKPIYMHNENALIMAIA